MKKRLWNELKKGFTLQETLIWVGIVGIFVSLMTVSGVAVWNRTRVYGAKQEMKLYSSAILEYYAGKKRGYPTEEEGFAVLEKYNYITNIEEDEDNPKFSDPWGTPYRYEVIEDGMGFRITSLGADKKEGGTGVRQDLTLTVSSETGGETSFE